MDEAKACDAVPTCALFQVLDAPLPMLPPLVAWESSGRWLKCLDSCYPLKIPVRSSCFWLPTWPRPGHCGHLGSEPIDGTVITHSLSHPCSHSLILSLSCSLSSDLCMPTMTSLSSEIHSVYSSRSSRCPHSLLTQWHDYHDTFNSKAKIEICSLQLHWELDILVSCGSRSVSAFSPSCLACFTNLFLWLLPFVSLAFNNGKRGSFSFGPYNSVYM